METLLVEPSEGWVMRITLEDPELGAFATALEFPKETQTEEMLVRGAELGAKAIYRRINKS